MCIWSKWRHCHHIMSCFIKTQIGLTFPVPAYPGCLGKEAVKRVSVFCPADHCIYLVVCFTSYHIQCCKSGYFINRFAADIWLFNVSTDLTRLSLIVIWEAELSRSFQLTVIWVTLLEQLGGCYFLLLALTLCIYVCLLRARVQPTLDPYAEAFL